MPDLLPDKYELPSGQMTLLPEPVDDEVLMQSELSQGICSGVQLKGSDPDRYYWVCALLADGSLSQRQISRLTRTSRNLVSAINRTQQLDIEPLKQQMASRARNIAQLASERIEELLRDPSSKLSLRDLGIVFGVATDKYLVQSDQATQRVEHIDASSGADDFERQFAALQQADVEDMGFEAEEAPAKGGRPDKLPAQGDVDDLSGGPDLGPCLDDGEDDPGGGDNG